MKKVMIDIIFCQECIDTVSCMHGFCFNEWALTCMKFVNGKIREMHKDSYLHTEIKLLEQTGYITTHEENDNFIKVKPNGFHSIDESLCTFCINPNHRFYKRTRK